MRTPGLVIMWRRTVDSPFDQALQLHGNENPGTPLDVNHEMLFVDVQFTPGTTRRLYVELTPGQISDFAADATKAVFWEPPSQYSKLREHEYLDGYRETFPIPGWGSYPVVVQKVCEEVLSSELRQVPVDFVKRLV